MSEGHGVRERLRAGEPVHAVTVNFAAPGLAEYLLQLGFDCVVLDGEHNAVDDATIEHAAMAAAAAGGSLLVRAPLNPAAIERSLALGAVGVHVPNVGSAAEAEAAVRAARFAPEGTRGLGSFRALRFAVADWPAAMAGANAQTLVLVAVETMAAAERVDEIAGVPGTDVVLVGELDLSCSLGVPGRPRHPKVRRVADRVIERALAAGRAVGLAASTPEQVAEARVRGASFVLTSCSALLRSGRDRYLCPPST